MWYGCGQDQLRMRPQDHPRQLRGPKAHSGARLILLWTLCVGSVFNVVGAIVNAVLGKHVHHTLQAALRSRPAETRNGTHVAVSVSR